MLRPSRQGLILVALAWAAPSAAQDRPFLFSVTTSDRDATQAIVYYDTAFGERPFDVSTDAGRLDQRLGVQASFGGRWTLLADAGFSTSDQASRTTVHSEVLLGVLSKRQHGVSLAFGGGLRHESSGIDVLIGRVTAARSLASTRLAGNVVFEHPVAALGRDALDVTTTVGWTARLKNAVHLGVEAIGEDLEGFWNAEEAEGGARVLVGPSVHVAPAQAKWQVTVTGGPLFHADPNPNSSDASRLLPLQSAAVGYAVRGSLAYGF